MKLFKLLNRIPLPFILVYALFIVILGKGYNYVNNVFYLIRNSIGSQNYIIIFTLLSIIALSMVVVSILTITKMLLFKTKIDNSINEEEKNHWAVKQDLFYQSQFDFSLISILGLPLMLKIVTIMVLHIS